ncbi:MAG: FAD:protein FMN transferase [Herbiconiux sp.]|uniref:FAD:protein FMN transferase n=1 Tax=Herbiconiux sp. TaxID=1871186 RepID=UPI0011FF7B07|nr:FAD:protein FMN transferase [Herbiconiux sp.]TAJ48181.1 MAG: FAD:protein FMN transferase [Herbiconiux sp.]
MTTAGLQSATSEWSVWTTEAALTVADADSLDAARTFADAVIAQVDQACSRFRPDSELALIAARQASGVAVSPLLEQLLRAALDAAALTGGAVDPTLGMRLDALGYAGSSGDETVSVTTTDRAWKRVTLEHGVLTAPAEVRFDLGATAKAFAADLIAATIDREVSADGVLVSLGGDIATAGPAPEGGWSILVQDLDRDPAAAVSLTAGMAIATSSTQKRRWLQHGVERHHILDPRFGLPAAPVWRTATVAAGTCVLANAYSTAAIVKGIHAPAWLESCGVTARLVDHHGRVVTTSSWPSGSERDPSETVEEFSP